MKKEIKSTNPTSDGGNEAKISSPQEKKRSPSDDFAANPQRFSTPETQAIEDPKIAEGIGLINDIEVPGGKKGSEPFELNKKTASAIVKKFERIVVERAVRRVLGQQKQELDAANLDKRLQLESKKAEEGKIGDNKMNTDEWRRKDNAFPSQQHEIRVGMALTDLTGDQQRRAQAYYQTHKDNYYITLEDAAEAIAQYDRQQGQPAAGSSDTGAYYSQQSQPFAGPSDTGAYYSQQGQSFAGPSDTGAYYSQQSQPFAGPSDTGAHYPQQSQPFAGPSDTGAYYSQQGQPFAGPSDTGAQAAPPESHPPTNPTEHRQKSEQELVRDLYQNVVFNRRVLMIKQLPEQMEQKRRQIESLPLPEEMKQQLLLQVNQDYIRQLEQQRYQWTDHTTDMRKGFYLVHEEHPDWKVIIPLDRGKEELDLKGALNYINKTFHLNMGPRSFDSIRDPNKTLRAGWVKVKTAY